MRFKPTFLGLLLVVFMPHFARASSAAQVLSSGHISIQVEVDNLDVSGLFGSPGFVTQIDLLPLDRLNNEIPVIPALEYKTFMPQTIKVGQHSQSFSSAFYFSDVFQSIPNPEEVTTFILRYHIQIDHIFWRTEVGSTDVLVTPQGLRSLRNPQLGFGNLLHSPLIMKSAYQGKIKARAAIGLRLNSVNYGEAAKKAKTLYNKIK